MANLKNIEVQRDDHGIKIDRWFKRHYPDVSYVQVQKAMRKGEIRIDGKRVKSTHMMHIGQMVRVPPFKIYEDKIKQKPAPIDQSYIDLIQKSVIYKDSNIIAINKPAGIPTQGGSGVKISIDDLLEYLKFDYDKKPKLVHRLDKDTSGVLLIARTASNAASIGKDFQNKKIEKVYWAIVTGCPKEPEGLIKIPLLKQKTGDNEKVVADHDGQKAVTHYKIMDYALNKLALVELKPQTGRTHQLRVHMAELGNPILGDGKYGGKRSFINGLSNKMHLHARQITLPSGISITADITEEFKKTVKMFDFDLA